MNEFAPYLIPIAGLIILGLILWLCKETVAPVVNGVVSGLAKSATSNAAAYAIAIGFGLSASLSAFVDVFHELTREQMTALSIHQYLALWAKVLNPFVVAILAYCQQSKFKQSEPPQPSP